MNKEFLHTLLGKRLAIRLTQNLKFLFWHLVIVVFLRYHEARNRENYYARFCRKREQIDLP